MRYARLVFVGLASIALLYLIIPLIGLILIATDTQDNAGFFSEQDVDHVVDSVAAYDLLRTVLNRPDVQNITDLHAYSNRRGIDPYYLFRFSCDRRTFERIRRMKPMKRVSAAGLRPPKHTPPEWFDLPYENLRGIEAYTHLDDLGATEYLVYYPKRNVTYYYYATM